VDILNSQNDGKATAALVLGVISLVFGLLLPIISVPCAIAGIILGALGLSSDKKGAATAGIILSIVGIFISIINWIIAFALFF
jgi:hypothetical protein